MYIYLLFIIIILSFLPFSKQIEDGIIRYKNFISKIILFIAYATILLIFSNISIRDTGIYALDLLWLILWIPILAKVFDIGIAKRIMPLRKELGIWMGTMMSVHTIQYFLRPRFHTPWELDFWLTQGSISYLAWGALAGILTFLLTVTSNMYSLKKMGKKWKYLHRTVYAVAIFTLLHVAFFQIERKGGELYTTITIVFIPFILYFLGKILEWKKIKIPITINIFIILILSVGLLTFTLSNIKGTPKEGNIEGKKPQRGEFQRPPDDPNNFKKR